MILNHHIYDNVRNLWFLKDPDPWTHGPMDPDARNNREMDQPSELLIEGCDEVQMDQASEPLIEDCNEILRLC